MSNTQQIAARLNELTDFIEEAQAKLNDGEVVNMTHLDDEVSALCDQTLALPPQEAAQIQPIMGEMISKLETLGIALKEFQANLKSNNGMS